MTRSIKEKLPFSIGLKILMWQANARHKIKTNQMWCSSQASRVRGVQTLRSAPAKKMTKTNGSQFRTAVQNRIFPKGKKMVASL
jgi:hypothetical protein